jgi:cell division protein FtsZ
MGIGSARGEDRAAAAARIAVSSPLLEASIEGARGVLLSISGGSDLGLFEINEAARLVSESAHPEANIIFGAVIDDALGDEVRVTVIAAGFDGGLPKPAPAAAPAAAVPAAPEAAVPAEAPAPVAPAAPAAPAGTDAAVPAPAPETHIVLPSEPPRPRRTIVFDDNAGVEDDLDVPDFLK